MFLCLSLMDVVSIGFIVPYISLITSPEFFFNNEFVQKYLITEGFNLEKKNEAVVRVGLGLVMLFILKSFFAIFINNTILKFCYNRGAELRSLLMHNYQTMNYDEFVQGNSSSYVFSIQSLTVGYSKGTLQSFLRLISDSIVASAIIIMLLITDAEVFLVFLSIVLILFLLYNYFFMEKIGNFGKLQNKYNKQIIKTIQEGIGGFKEVRILGKEEYFYDKVRRISSKFAAINIKNNLIQTLPRYLVELVIIVFIVAVVMITLFRGESILSIAPILSMFGVAAIRLTPSIIQIISSLSQLKYQRNAVELLYKDLKRFDSNLKFKNEENNSNLKPLQEVHFNKLELVGVSYKYSTSKHYAIENLNLKISKGDFVGIIGKSGSGKTTLVDIMLGLLKPSEGKVLFNGQDLEKNLIQFQSQAAYLPQETFIIDTSLRNNISIQGDINDVDFEKINQSINGAKLNEVIDKLPLGIDSRLGENGALLSGGQRQRISLARSFYHDREFFIFDESTSALDEDTEKEIYDEIKKLKGIKTIVIITHRTNVLKNCDFVYNFDS